MRKLIVRNVWIEPDECGSCLCCVDNAPGLIEFDETVGVSRVCAARVRQTYEVLGVVLAASQVCPHSAVYVETDSGETFNIDDAQ